MRPAALFRHAPTGLAMLLVVAAQSLAGCGQKGALSLPAAPASAASAVPSR